MDPALVQNLRDLLGGAIGHPEATPSLILADRRSPLSRTLVEGYRGARPAATFVDVDAVEPATAIAAVDALPPGALVVLLESTRFELGEFRFRLELFRRGLAVVEHPHLGRVPEVEIPVYLDSLAYDRRWYRGMGHALKGRIDGATRIEVHTAGAVATWQGAFEPARLNVGDYAGMANVGGQFPIGEVFTELVDVEGLDGAVTIGAFGGADFSVRFGPPFTLHLTRGRVVGAPDAPPEFAAILATITAAEGEVWVRELGFGLNRAMTETRRLTDVSAYERMCGIHLSLGAKHAVYPKPGFNKRHTRFHVDVFCADPTVLIEGERVYADAAWTVTAATE